MPYCPKCDMEFIDGITTCSDCGGPLVESEEAYKKELQQKMERAYRQQEAQAQQFYQANQLMQREVPLSRAAEKQQNAPSDFNIPTMTLNFGNSQPKPFTPAAAPEKTPAEMIKEVLKDAPKTAAPMKLTAQEQKELRGEAAEKYAKYLRRTEAQRLLGGFSVTPVRHPSPMDTQDAPQGGMPAPGTVPNRSMAPNPAPAAPQAAQAPQAAAPQQARGRGPKAANVYVSTSQKMEDRRSSSFAFLLVGGIITVFGLACWLGIIKLPMVGTSLYFFQGVITAMGLAFLIISLNSLRSVKGMAAEADAEKKQNTEIIEWFTSNWSGADLDKAIFSMENDLEQQEIELRRYALIQYRVVKEKQLTSQTYVDYIVEEIYNVLYPDE